MVLKVILVRGSFGNRMSGARVSALNNLSYDDYDSNAKLASDQRRVRNCAGCECEEVWRVSVLFI